MALMSALMIDGQRRSWPGHDEELPADRCSATPSTFVKPLSSSAPVRVSRRPAPTTAASGPSTSLPVTLARWPSTTRSTRRGELQQHLAASTIAVRLGIAVSYTSTSTEYNLTRITLIHFYLHRNHYHFFFQAKQFCVINLCFFILHCFFFTFIGCYSALNANVHAYCPLVTYRSYK